MSTIETHESEAIVDATGAVRVPNLPFAMGERVRVLVMHDRSMRTSLHTDDEIQRSKAFREALKGTVLEYDGPDDPVALEDWEAVTDEGKLL